MIMLKKPLTGSLAKQCAFFQDIEDELRRLKQEMKQITLKYNIACQEAVTARDKVYQVTTYATW